MTRAAIRAVLPRAPGFYVEEIEHRLATMQIPQALQRRTILDMAEAVIRHQLTDYDRLTKDGHLLPAEALLVVGEEVADYLAEWRGERA